MLPDCTRDPEGLALLTACKESPLDLAPRLILTDWLEDHGEDDVARCLRESMAGDGCMVPLPTRAQERWQPLNGCDHGWLCLRPVAETVERKLDELRDCPWFGAVSLAKIPFPVAHTLIHEHPAMTQLVRLDSPGAWSPARKRVDGEVTFRNLTSLTVESALIDREVVEEICHDHRLPRLLEFMQVGDSLSSGQARIFSKARWRNQLRTLRLGLWGTSWEDLRNLLGSRNLTAVESLAFSGPARYGDQILRRLNGKNVLPALRRLALSRMDVSADALRTFLMHDSERPLEALDLSDNDFGDAGLESLAAWPGLASVTALRLARVHAGAAGLAALAASKYATQVQTLDVGDNSNLNDRHGNLDDCDLPNLTRLNMAECGLFGTTIQALSRSPLIAGTAELDLSYNRMGGWGTHCLSEIPDWRVRKLNLAQNFTTEDGLLQLVRAANWTELRQLNMDENGIRGDCLRFLASWQPAALEALSLSRNPLDDHGLRALASWPALVRLRELTLAQVGASHAGLHALLDSPHLGRLDSLNLWGNRITNAGADALANCEALKTLTDLYISEEHLTDTGKAALRNSPHLRHTIIHW